VQQDILHYEGGPVLDAYLPRNGQTKRPASYWPRRRVNSGDRAEFAPYAMRAATEQHWAAFAVNYRLDENDKAAWPDELHDVQAAIRFIVSQASTYGIDTANVLLMGDSAGANLAALISEVGTANPITGTAVGTDPTTDVPILAVALWSPPVDLADLVGHAGQAPTECGSDKACDFIWPLPTSSTWHRAPRTTPRPTSWVSDTAELVVNSSNELVPLGQVVQYVMKLQAATSKCSCSTARLPAWDPVRRPSVEPDHRLPRPGMPRHPRPPPRRARPAAATTTLAATRSRPEPRAGLGARPWLIAGAIVAVVH
jgi:hypothetical protein